MRALAVIVRWAVAVAGVALLTSCGSDSECRCAGGEGGGDPTLYCYELVPTVVEHPAFSGSGPCGGVPQRYVLSDQAAVDAHVAEFCDLQAQCEDPAPPCEPAPTFTGDIVYVHVSAPACEIDVSIDLVRACPDNPRIAYVFDPQGDCQTQIGAWTAVMVGDLGDEPPIFIEESASG